MIYCFSAFFLLAELFGHLRSSSIIFDHLRSCSIIFDHLRSSSILVQRRAFLCSYVQWAVFCTPALPRGYQRKQVTRWALARGVALSEVFSTTWFLPSKDGLGETVLVVYVASFLDIICGWGIEWTWGCRGDGRITNQDACTTGQPKTDLQAEKVVWAVLTRSRDGNHTWVSLLFHACCSIGTNMG